MNKYALELKGLSKAFNHDLRRGKQVVINDLSCGFRAGACTGLLGHNGAGKTTTIRMILGLVHPDAGTILFDGAPLTAKMRRVLGYMPEVRKLALSLTPDEALNHQLRLYAPQLKSKQRQQRLDETLTRVGLEAHRKKKSKYLSKGMARRLAWALATVHHPRLLILDEPASGLDPLGRQEMLAWIRDERARGASIVLCTHDLTHVDAVCDDFHILRAGRLVLSTIHPSNAEPAAPSIGTPRPWRAPYNLQVTGCDEVQLHKLAAQAHLPAWVFQRREGFLHILGFTEYTHAAAWIEAAVKAGLVIVRYGDSAFTGEDELLAHFERT